MTTRIRSRRPAFTLIEMLVAMFITSLVCIVLWDLFGSGTRAMAYGTWYSSRIAELRTTLRILREDLAKATYPSVIKLSRPSVTVTDTDPNFYVGYHPGKTTFPFTGNLLLFHICRPDRTAMPEATPACDILGTLEGAGAIGRYSRKGQSGTYGPEEEYNPAKLLDTVHDVDFVEVTLIPNVVGDADGSQATGDSTGTLTLKIHCTYPWDKQKGCEETTNCKLNIKYKTI